MSLPSRERGLKCEQSKEGENVHWSLPSRERGLKSLMMEPVIWRQNVAPLAGAWIEIGWRNNNLSVYGRSPRGSVD